MEKKQAPDTIKNNKHFIDTDTASTITLKDGSKIKILPDTMVERFLKFTLSSFQQGHLRQPKGGENDRCG